MKIRSVVAELFHADRRKEGRTDLTKLVIAFCSFTNDPVNAGSVGKFRKSVAIIRRWNAERITHLEGGGGVLQ